MYFGDTSGITISSVSNVNWLHVYTKSQYHIFYDVQFLYDTTADVLHLEHGVRLFISSSLFLFIMNQ